MYGLIQVQCRVGSQIQILYKCYITDRNLLFQRLRILHLSMVGSIDKSELLKLAEAYVMNKK